MLERAGEVVGRAERQDAKRQPGFDQGVGSGIEGAVPAADDDQIGLGAVLDNPRAQLAHVGRALFQNAHAAFAQHLEHRSHIGRALSARDVGEQERRPLRPAGAGAVRVLFRQRGRSPLRRPWARAVPPPAI